MKRAYFFLILLSGITMTSFRHSESPVEEVTFRVWGICEMCETRIENAVDLKGVVNADWDLKTSMMTVAFKPEKISLDEIMRAIADAGHDTEKLRASDSAYNSLHSCCHYQRPLLP
jgi:mercuric ion binding protein